MFEIDRKNIREFFFLNPIFFCLKKELFKSIHPFRRRWVSKIHRYIVIHRSCCYSIKIQSYICQFLSFFQGKKADSDDEEEADFKAKLKQWKTVGEVGGKKRTAEYVYKSVDDILAEGKFRKIKKDEVKTNNVKVSVGVKKCAAAKGCFFVSR